MDCNLTLMTSNGLTMMASVMPEARPAIMKVWKENKGIMSHLIKTALKVFFNAELRIP